MICNCLIVGKGGAPGKIRTPDPLIRSQVLYPAVKRLLFLWIPCRHHELKFEFRSSPHHKGHHHQYAHNVALFEFLNDLAFFAP